MTNEANIKSKPDELSQAIEQNRQVADLFGSAIAYYEANNKEAFIADYKSALEIDASATIYLLINHLIRNLNDESNLLPNLMEIDHAQNDLAEIFNMILNHLSYELCVTTASAFNSIEDKIAFKKHFRSSWDSVFQTIALKLLSRAIELEPDKSITYKLRADIKREMDNIAAALSDYQKSLEYDSCNDCVHTLIADVYMQLGNHLKSIAHYSEALKLNTDNVEYYGKRATAYVLLKMHNKAFADYEQALSVAPNNPGLLFNRALLFGQLGEYEKGLDDITCVLKYYSDRIKGFNLYTSESIPDDVLITFENEKQWLKRADSIKAFLNYKILLRDNKIDEIGKLDLKAISPKMIYFIALDYFSHINNDAGFSDIIASAKDAFYNSQTWPCVHFPKDFFWDDIARLCGVKDGKEALSPLVSGFTLQQWVIFIEKWFLEDDVISPPRKYNLREYAIAFDDFIDNISQINISNTSSKLKSNMLFDKLLCLHKKYCDFNLLDDITHIPIEAIILKTKSSILKYIMDDYERNLTAGIPPINEPLDVELDQECMEDYATLGQIIRMLPFYHMLNKALQDKYTELLLKSEREKAEREINARVEERNRVIQDMSHSIKNVMASVIDPLNELAEKYTDQRVTIQKALRGATIIRETVNALNLSYRGCIEDFVRDAESARCAPAGKAEFKHLLDMALECAVNNMFDGKYFADFTHSYFPTREIFNAAEPAWQLSRSGESSGLIDFLGRYMFDYHAEYPKNISTFRLDDRYNSPLKLTILFQELLLNAVKYACFADRKERFVAIKVEADNTNFKIIISNSFVPGKSARTTRIGNEIVNNFVKLLAGTYSVDKTDRIYSVTLQFPNIFSTTCQESLLQATDKAVCTPNALEDHENSICGR